MRILITGAKGQLGTELVNALGKDHQIIPTDRSSLDFTIKEMTQRKISKENPNLVIHAGAWTNVDGCAKDSKKALFINGEGTANVAEAVKRIDGRLIYISTNEVFDGEKRSPYKEDDQPNPITSYGQSKWLGEKKALEILEKNCCVIRVSWLYGPASTNNFPNKIIAKGREQGFLKVVDDEVSTPTYTPDVAAAISDLIKEDTEGIFHLVNSGQASRYDWAKKILEFAKITKVPIDPIKLADFERESKPPAYAVLKNERASAMGIILRDWEDACREYIETKNTFDYNNPA